jgi:hypothetical protein
MKYMKNFRLVCACLVFFYSLLGVLSVGISLLKKSLTIYGQTSSLAGELPLGQE